MAEGPDDNIVVNSGSSQPCPLGKGDARTRSASRLTPGANDIPPPPENIGCVQHHLKFSVGSVIAPFAGAGLGGCSAITEGDIE